MTTYYVRKSGSDGNSGLTELLAKLTIASAITASTTGDTIDIGVGTWAENINSARVYKGVSMYKSIISAVTSMWGGLTMTFQNVQIKHTTFTTTLAGTSLTYIDAKHDLSAIGASGVLCWYNIATVSMTRSVFIGSSSGFSNAVFAPLAGQTFTIDHCIFYDCFGTTAFCDKTTAGAIFHFTNSIVYIASKGTAEPVSKSSTAWNTEQYNCFYSLLSTLSTLPGGAFGTGTLNDIDPQFRDAVGGDFNLSDSSTCIGKGHA